MDQPANVCACHHHKVIPVLAVVLGAVFLLRALDIISMHTAAVTWPVTIILAGLFAMRSQRCGCCGH